MRISFKRIGTDAAGYLLLIAAVLTGWLPGPVGVPLALAGLGLLSIHNAWARRLREWLIAKSGSLAQMLFPKNKLIEFSYDFIAFLLLLFIATLLWLHDAVWQISLALFSFCIGAVLALANRSRWQRFKQKRRPTKS